MLPRLVARRTALPLLLAACSYDGSGLAGAELPSSSSTTSESTSGSTAAPATSSTTESPEPTTSTDTTTGTTAPVDPTTGTTTGDITTSTSTSDPSTSTTELSTTTGDDTTGEPPPMLVDVGLVARYFLAEAANGQGPTHALDAAPEPLDLPLVYAAMGGMNPVYVEQDGGRGLRWPAAGLDGRATASVSGTKIQERLDGRTAATIEVVVDIDAVTGMGSRISHIGAGAEPGRLSLRSGNINRLEFYWKDNVLAGVWPVDLDDLGRIVVHLVLDTGQPDPLHRVRLYIDGAAVSDGMDGMLTDPGQNEAIVIPDGNDQLHYTLGNRGVDSDRSFQGALYYAALYDVALSESQLAHNAELLLVGDDGP